jgi:hypothetical protein
VPRRVASASTSLRRSSGIETMTFATSLVYQGIRPERGGTDLQRSHPLRGDDSADLRELLPLHAAQRPRAAQAVRLVVMAELLSAEPRFRSAVCAGVPQLSARGRRSSR